MVWKCKRAEGKVYNNAKYNWLVFRFYGIVFDFVSSKSLVCINCMLIFYKVFGQSCKWYISQNFHWGIFLKHKIFTTNSLPATNVDSWDTRGMTRKYAVDFLFVLVWQFWHMSCLIIPYGKGNTSSNNNGTEEVTESYERMPWKFSSFFDTNLVQGNEVPLASRDLPELLLSGNAALQRIWEEPCLQLK